MSKKHVKNNKIPIHAQIQNKSLPPRDKDDYDGIFFLSLSLSVYNIVSLIRIARKRGGRGM